jgi:hypothetical protein
MHACRLGRRERPHLVFDDDLRPVALTTAVTVRKTVALNWQRRPAQLTKTPRARSFLWQMPPTKRVGHPKQLDRWPDASFTFMQAIRR